MNRLASLVATMLVVTGCQWSGSSDPGSAGPKDFDEIRYTQVWERTSHLDLLSAEGTFVRAFIESETRGQ